MPNKKISAIDIEKLWYFPISKISADLTGSALYTLLQDSDTKEVENVHQDTWSIDEGDPSQDFYRNQLTGAVYREGAKTMGDLTFNWTIGRYDYETKKDFLGGTVIYNGTGQSQTAVGWKRDRGITVVKLGLIARTEDKQYCVLPCANISTREANTDGATGLAVVGTMLEPENPAVNPEYWFDSSEVVSGGG